MAVVPNENGVYAKDAAECITFPNAKGQVYCEIYVLPVDGVWIGGYSYGMGGTDMRGGGSPLMKDRRHLRQPDHIDRQSCVAEEARRLLRNIQNSDCKQAPAIREWLQGLIDGPDQLDMFAAA